VPINRPGEQLTEGNLDLSTSPQPLLLLLIRSLFIKIRIGENFGVTPGAFQGAM